MNTELTDDKHAYALLQGTNADESDTLSGCHPVFGAEPLGQTRAGGSALTAGFQGHPRLRGITARDKHPGQRPGAHAEILLQLLEHEAELAALRTSDTCEEPAAHRVCRQHNYRQ